MDEYESLLYPLFNELRILGVPLGISEYLLAIQSIRRGLGLENPTTLRNLCRILWTKSLEDQKRFDVLFERLVEPRLKPNLDHPTLPIDADPLIPISSTTPSITIQGASTSQDKDPSVLTKQSKPRHLIPDKQVRQAQPPPGKQEGQIVFHSIPLNLSTFVPTAQIYQKRKYHVIPRLQLDRRDMAGLWRHLRSLRREGPPEELDLEGTIDDVCQRGFFLGPVLQARRRNQAKLVLLIDQKGSMEPFSLLIDELIECAFHGGLLGQAKVFYFHDCPESLLFDHPNLSIALPLKKVLFEEVKGNCVLIVSDAGAARGYYDGKRLDQTRKFLKSLNETTYLYAWLNPMPSSRWRTTTAEDIARLIPMFQLDKEGLNDAINILRGHPFPSGVGLDGSYT